MEKKTIIWINAIKKAILCLSQVALFVTKKVIYRKTVKTQKMEFSIKEAVVTFVVIISIKKWIVHCIRNLERKNLNLILKIINFLKMEKKYDKRKLGVIHPLMDKLPRNEAIERISDDFVIKGENLRKF